VTEKTASASRASDGVLAQRVLAWQAQHGRQGLPWQNTRDPYRVWLSEIMLQQTQVSTVLGYYPRFLQRFPDVQTLAQASQSDVLALWSGMGYYSRARNLHRCAQTVVQDFAGEFPRSAELLQTLPGIGRSTAAAIAAFCFAQRVAILDANVKRVLTRVLGFDADIARPANERALWQHATDLLPRTRLTDHMPRYTQGMMDIGATLCLPKKPNCLVCPLAQQCKAKAQNDPQRYPVKTRTLKRSTQSLWLLWAQHEDGRVFVVQRPGTGIWAGLHCLPVFETPDALWAQLSQAQRNSAHELPAFKHVLTHKDLHLHPVQVPMFKAITMGIDGHWMTLDALEGRGLPAPIRALLLPT
jgi:A/G-specific adenine glycosylase